MSVEDKDPPSPGSAGVVAAGDSSPEDGEQPAVSGDAQTAGAPKISSGRLALVDGLIVVATALLVVGVFAVWANRLLFNPDNWENTSTQLLTNPTIRSTTANYAVDQLYANVNVPALIASGLPPRLQPLATPAAGALRNVAVQGVNAALARPRVQDLWARANRAADQAFIAVANGGKGAVGVNQGVVTLDLAQTVDTIAARLGLPPNLGAKLPPNIAHLTILRSNQLKVIQNGGNAIRHLALWLTILAPLLYVLSLVLAQGHRRRTLMTIGFSGILAGLLVIVLRSILNTQITNSLTSDASVRPAISATVAIGTQMLHQIAAACMIVAIPLVIAAWFAGPAGLARTMRVAIAPSLRERPVGAYVLTLVVMALIFIWDPIHATGTPAGIIVFTALALVGMFFLRRETAREFPDAQLGDTTRRVRARLDARRQRKDAESQVAAPSASGPSVPDQLRELADLRDRGALTSEDYRVAKAQLLHSNGAR